MKLKHDCVRDILLTIEDIKEFNVFLPIQKLMKQDKLINYSKDDICYTLFKLEEAGFINLQVASFQEGNFPLGITDMTYQGHEFLKNIRQSSVWSETKSLASKVGSTSLTILSVVAAGVVKAQLGLS
ncbi:DUF2513 domain-containing protein [Bacillus velezensis]|uniref:DUF2513 domain-containing protein n=1 Tax=Bacillus velezensis TaxID=492670 RepID=UPI00145C28A2|nr:DUF2513 domain-containing protein [Bacillus velezensis]MCA1233286.1 DUF2513 domain-containing protein [Bacillus velezensis]MCA1311386.1 DUF2513 domain-containing protein [Bacillus velezensis]MCA1330377.1 DUF2513 domain-containing protein [Bacillus velezensis]NMP63629.1 DUF2513 domain-containing protein [Bacillus velezensis]